jgi:hypothetical protein
VRRKANPRFWRCYEALPEEVQRLADNYYHLLLRNLNHPSLHFKKIGRFWSVRAGLHYRALALERGVDVVRFWIASHSQYNRLIGSRGA